MDELLTDLARRMAAKYYGKYRGFVANADDPEQLGRLQLRIPSLLGTEVTGWAQPCLPFGGSAGVGWFAIPPRDAQVWVEFEEGNLRWPIWTGTVWQKKGDPPKEAQKTPPTTHLLQTAAGHRLQFDDTADRERLRLRHAGGAELAIDERGTISITDQSGNAITLDAEGAAISIADTHHNAIALTSRGVKLEDGHGNAIELASTGITLTSRGAIVLDGKRVDLGGSGGEPVIKGRSFLDLLATHVHTSAAPGSPTSPPAPQGEVSTLSTSVKTK